VAECERADRYAKCIEALDTAKFDAAMAVDEELANEIQTLIDKADERRNALIDNNEGGNAWVSPF
jgi:hypothetical protein